MTTSARRRRSTAVSVTRPGSHGPAPTIDTKPDMAGDGTRWNGGRAAGLEDMRRASPILTCACVLVLCAACGDDGGGSSGGETSVGTVSADDGGTVNMTSATMSADGTATGGGATMGEGSTAAPMTGGDTEACMMCGDVCVDLNSDAMHCGACDSPCDPGF